MPWTTVNAESEITRNSAGNRIRMTDSGQSRKEAAVMTTGTVSAKTTTLIGFWNVQTMYEQGRMAQVIAEMIYQSSPPFTPKAFDVSYASFGLMSFPTKIFLNGVEPNQWLPS